MINSDLSTTTETDLGYGHLLAILVRRGFWFLGVFSGVLIVTALAYLREKPVYKSSMQLIVEPNYREELRQTDLNGSSPDEIDYATQLTLMRSDEFVQGAVNLLRPAYPNLSVEEVQGSLVVYRIFEGNVETRIFEAVYTGSDPDKTKRVLEALQTSYLQYNLEQQKDRLGRGLESIDRQLQTARQNLEESQNSLEQFRQKQNLIDPTQQAQAVASSLDQVEQEQRTLEAQYRDAQARSETLQQQLSRSPQAALLAARLSQSPRFQTLLNELQQTELELAERQVIFSDLDPSVQSLQEQRQNQLILLRQEAGRVLGQVPTELEGDNQNLQAIGQLSQVDLDLVGGLAEVQANLVSLEARRQSLLQAEQRLRTELNRFPGLIAQYDRLQPEVETQRAVLQQLLSQREQISSELARGGYNWQVVEAPQLGRKTGRSATKSMMLGAVVGLFLGGAAAFVREAMDAVVHTPADLKKKVALPLLGILPEYDLDIRSNLSVHLPFYRSYSGELFTLETVLWQPFRESLDLAYRNIFLNSEREIKSLVVTSGLPGEGKTTLVLGLALAAARLEQRVLIIDADLRCPSLHEKLNLPNNEGLSSLLTGDNHEIEPIQYSFSNVTIDVLTAGSSPADPVKLLSSHRMREAIAAFETAYDLVLVDTAPILGRVDALQTASCCSAMILVIQLNRIKQDELNEAISMLNSVNVLGIIANGSRNHLSQYTNYTSQNGRFSSRVSIFKEGSR